MTIEHPLNRRLIYGLLALIFLASLPIKLAAARNMPWDMDFVPVLSRSVEYALPPVGTLSSVAAYNLPMLQWLHLPALHLTHNAYAAILLTMLTFNLLTTIAVFCIGDSMFNGRVGLAAALLFTFSEVGISSAYTAWAQLLLPGFYAMTFLFLWEWRRRGKGVYLATAGVLATAAFMTHFSAIMLYPAMLVFALMTRAKWQWGWFAVGTIIVGLLLAPYLFFEARHDFVDIRAFLKQESRVAPDVLEQVRYLKPESGPLPREQVIQECDNCAASDTTTSQTPSNPSTTPSTVNHPATQPRWQRALAFLGSVPGQYVRGWRFGFDTRLRSLPNFWQPVLFLPMALFLISGGWGLWRMIANVRRNGVFSRETLADPHPASPEFEGGVAAATEGVIAIKPNLAHLWHTISTFLVDTPAGRILLLLLFEFTIISGLIVTRSINQPTYFMGLMSLHVVIAAGVLAIDWSRLRWIPIVIFAGIIAYAGLTTADRVARLRQHDDSVYSRFNVSIYRHVSDAADFIADDWQGGATLTVSYDIMPEMRNLWWIPAWHSIDPTYRMGANFDFLLTYHHGLTNTNTNPIGYVETADYFVVYEPGLVRFQLEDYAIAQFGTIYVLKEQS